MKEHTKSNRNSPQDLKELRRELSLIQARRDTEHDLPEELKHKLWLEAKQVDELVDRRASWLEIE